MKNPKDINSISIPLDFTLKELYIGKGSLKNDKSNYKFTSQKPSDKNIGSTLKYNNLKEFTLVNKDKSKKNIIYKGREAPQDSCYILMKYNSDHRCMQLYKANKWINFVQSFNYAEESREDKEAKKKNELKEKNKIFKSIFNFDHMAEMTRDKKAKKSTRKKKDILANNNEEDEDFDENNKEKDYSDEDGMPKKGKKKNEYEFEEDSHSSEDDPNLADDSYESEIERKKEEERLREEEKKNQKNKENDKNESEEEEFEEDDRSFNDQPSDVDENDDNFLDDLLTQKRKREKNSLEENMKEELDNLLRKNNRMKYEEIFGELIKKFKGEQVEQYIEKLLDENTEKFHEKGQIYYFIK